MLTKQTQATGSPNQLYGTEPIVILNQSRWDPAQTKVYLACLFQTKNPDWDIYFTGYEVEMRISNQQQVCLPWMRPRKGLLQVPCQCLVLLKVGLCHTLWRFPNNPLTQPPSDPNFPQRACNPIKYAIKDTGMGVWLSDEFLGRWEEVRPIYYLQHDKSGSL